MYNSIVLRRSSSLYGALQNLGMVVHRPWATAFLLRHVMESPVAPPHCSAFLTSEMFAPPLLVFCVTNIGFCPSLANPFHPSCHLP